MIWALSHVLMLRLESRSLTLFACGSDVADAYAAVIAGHDTARSPIEHMAIRLLSALEKRRAQPCIKGRFFDRMQAKVDQLARHYSNELVAIDLQAMADMLERSGPGLNDFQLQQFDSIGARTLR